MMKCHQFIVIVSVHDHVPPPLRQINYYSSGTSCAHLNPQSVGAIAATNYIKSHTHESRRRTLFCDEKQFGCVLFCVRSD